MGHLEDRVGGNFFTIDFRSRIQSRDDIASMPSLIFQPLRNLPCLEAQTARSHTAHAPQRWFALLENPRGVSAEIILLENLAVLLYR